MKSGKRRYALGERHPSLILAYFLLLFFLLMFTVNPLIRLLALVGGVLTSVTLFERELNWQLIKAGSLIIILSGITNFLFVHHGGTKFWQVNFVLFSRTYRFAFTLESLTYGLSFGILLAALLIWFQIMSRLFQGEHLNYLIARPLPKLALVMNLVLSFVPQNLRRYEELNIAQDSLGLKTLKGQQQRRQVSQGILVTLFSWSLNTALVTSDSMSARGYGEGRRSHFSIYRFKQSDWFFSCLLITLVLILFVINKDDPYKFYYYPRLRLIKPLEQHFLAYLPLVILFLLPFILEIKEALKWRYFQSKI